MTIIYFILILGVTVLVHEAGHFIFAKIFKVHVYEFSIGMGKKLFSFNRKNDETIYSIRIFPIGGYVKLAGEEVNDDEDIPKENKLACKKPWQRFLIFVFGAVNNFIFAFLLLILMGLIFGSTTTKPIMGNIKEDYPSYKAGLRNDDVITSINGNKIKTYEDVKLIFALDPGATFNLTAVDVNGKEKKIVIVPEIITQDDSTLYKYGISKDDTKKYGLINSLKYSVEESYSIFRSMFKILGGLFTGNVSVSNLSGPVGIYTAVDVSSQSGLYGILYLVVLIGINVGVLNLLPIPAFDGGRIFFLLIEKIKGSPINTKVENVIHSVFFILLMGLMIYITIFDVLRLF